MPLKFRRRTNAAGGVRVGDNSHYTDINTSGVQTMTGNAQVSKDIWIPAQDFKTASGTGPQSGSEFEGGSMMTASLPVSISGSIFLNTDQDLLPL